MYNVHAMIANVIASMIVFSFGKLLLVLLGYMSYHVIVIAYKIEHST